jgi:hypothetical protein
MTFPYFADFCKQILATGKVCASKPLPGGLRCNPRRPSMSELSDYRPRPDPYREPHDPARKWRFLPIAQLAPALPGFTGPKTYAAWPVWRDSTTAEVKFQPLPKKEAARRWHRAKRFDRQTHLPGKHGGAIGPAALEVLRVLLFEFLEYATGRLEPSYDAIAAKAGLCRRTVAAALRRLRDLGLLHWLRRAKPAEDGGGFRLVQETNAYASLPPSQWRGYFEPPPAPPPEPGTWGEHPPLPDQIAQAAEEIAAQPSAHRTALAMLDADPGNPLAAALARFGRALFGPRL